MKGLIDKIINLLSIGCVVEVGTANNWKYKKYSDGTYEGVYTLQHTGININQGPSAGEYYSADIWVAYRPVFAKTVDGVIATPFAGSMSSGPRVYRVLVDSNNVVRCALRAQTSLTNVSIQVAYKIWGTW